MFNLDINKLVSWHLPAKMKQGKFFNWLSGLCFPLTILHNSFITKRNDNLYKIEHNSQVFSICNVLNDRFDNVQRRIYITDGFTKDRVYIYTRLEDKPIYLGELPLHNRGDYSDTGLDFIVWIPTAIFITPQDQIEINALVKFYKLAGKRFNVYRV